MTALHLLVYISLLLLGQFALVLGWGLFARRKLPVAQSPAPVPGSKKLHGAWADWRDFRVTRRDYEDAAHTQCSFYLAPVDGLALPAYKPGQYLTFRLPIGSNGGIVTRCYSLSDSPDPNAYRITVKRAVAPKDRPDLSDGISSTYFHDMVVPDALLQVKAPGGHFFNQPDELAPAVLIGGGIGITPMMSMLRWSLIAQPNRDIHLYYGTRCTAEQAFTPVLHALASSHSNFHLHLVHSQPDDSSVAGRDYHHQGYIDLALIQKTLPHGRHQFYVCGPPAMMQSLVPALMAWGVQRDNLFFEAFGPANVVLPGDASNATSSSPSPAVDIQFSMSGRTLAWTGQDANLLDFAERHGITVESGCRSGGCGSCETGVLSGSVHYASPPDHDVAAGHCLLCVGTPQTNLVLQA